MGRLVAEGSLVEEIADEAEGEDGRGEAIAGCLGAAAEEAGEGLVVVFCEGRRWVREKKLLPRQVEG